MNGLKLDTLAFANRLKAAGADHKLAEAIASGPAEVELDEELATKAGVAKVQTDISEIKVELKWIKLIGGAILAVLIFPWLAEIVSGSIPGAMR